VPPLVCIRLVKHTLVGLFEDTKLCAIHAKSFRHAQRHPVGLPDAGRES
jgi:hypothetical protein